MKILRGIYSGGLVVACSGQTPFEPNYNPPAVFSNATAITNPLLPLSSLTQDVLDGTEGGKSQRVIRTRLPGTHTFTFNGQPLQTIIVSDTVYLDGQLKEVALDYFAQSDHGDVYYLGEDVDDYENGQVVSHGGAWHFGIDTDKLGILLPAAPKVGDRFRSEDVPGITREDDEVVAVNETVVVPAGTFQNCVKVREILSDGAVEYKYYAPGVGVVKEVPEDGVSDLQTHT